MSPEYHAFISYSRREENFARILGDALGRFKPPHGLDAPKNPLNIFRDKKDLAGPEYHAAIASNLQNSKKLIVICTPSARKSNFVNEEIDLFARQNGAKNIISILLSGVPNNEATADDENNKAFPEALCRLMDLPLAIDYRGFELEKYKVNKGIYENSWYTLLADIFDVSRRQIEERDRKRKRRQIRWIISITAVIMAMLITLAAVALWQRSVALEQLRIADSRRLAAEGSNMFTSDLNLGLLLSLEAQQSAKTIQAQRALLAGLETHPNLAALLRGHRQGVVDIAFSPNGKLLASLGRDRIIIIWDVQSGRQIGKPFKAEGYRLEWSPDGQTIAFVFGKTVHLLNIDSGIKKVVDRPRLYWVDIVKFSPDGQNLVTGGSLGKVAFWDVDTGQVLGETTKAHTKAVTSLVYSHDGSFLASASADGTINLWDASKQQPSGIPLSGYSGKVHSLAFSPDDRTLAVGVKEKILFYEVADGQPRGELNTKPFVDNIIFSLDGTMLFASGGKDIALIDISAEPLIRGLLTGHNLNIAKLIMAADGVTLASINVGITIGGYAEIRLWDLSRWHPSARLPQRVLAKRIAFSPDGDFLAFSDTVIEENFIRVWDIAQNTVLPHKLEWHPGGVKDLAYSPDGSLLAAAGCRYSYDASGRRSQTGEIRMWDASTFEAKNPLREHMMCVERLTFSPDKRLLASAARDGIFLWELGSKKPQFRLSNDSAKELAFSPSGSLLASSDTLGRIRLWDVRSYQPIGDPLRSQQHYSLKLAFLSEETLVSASWFDSQLVFWDLRTATHQTLPVVTDGNLGPYLDFSPDRSILASGHERGHVISLWDVQSGHALCGPLLGHRDSVLAVAFSPKGKLLASASWDKTVLLWNVDPGDTRKRACRLVHRNLTCNEWATYIGERDPNPTCPGKAGCEPK